METREKGVIYVQLTIKTTERRHVNDVVLMSLLSTLTIFHTFS